MQGAVQGDDACAGKVSDETKAEEHTEGAVSAVSREQRSASEGGGLGGESSGVPSGNEMKTMTPMPWGQLLPVVVLWASCAISISVVLPITPFMVEDFGVQKVDVGYYSGWLGSVWSLGQFMSAWIWGWLSDRAGRKPCLLAGTFFSTVGCVVFGFSSSFKMAVAARFFTGLLNGVVGVTKSYLAEVCDETNQGKGMGIIGGVWSAGLLLGPPLGGILSRPSDIWSALEGSFLDAFPYALPCLLVAFLGTVGLVTGTLLLKETVPLGTRTEFWMSLYRRCGMCARCVSSGYKGRTKIEKDVELSSSIVADDSLSSDSVASEGGNSSIGIVKPLRIFTLLKQRKVFGVIAMYGCIAAVFICFDSVYAVWATGPSPEGLMMSIKSLGLVLTFGGVSTLLFQLFAYHRIVARTGPRRLYIIGILMSAPLFSIVPYSGLVFSSAEQQFPLQAGLLVLRSIFSMCCFTSVFVMTNNSTTRENLGVVNGVGASVAVFPATATSVYAATLQTELPGFRFIFFCMTGLCLLPLFAALIMPVSIDRRLGQAGNRV